MDEASLLNHIYARSAGLALPAGRLLVGPGDDTAVLRTPGGDTVLLTVDQLVAARHFEPALLETEEGRDLVARKAVARSISDIAAMGGAPTWSLATALLPKAFAHADHLFDRMAHWASHWKAPLIGGDIASLGDEPGPLSLTTTVGGLIEQGAEPILRSGARAGDAVFVTGSLGASLASGWHLRFEPRLSTARALRGVATSMIDLSDGLGRDAGRVAVRSGVRLTIEAALLPMNHRCKSWRDAAGDGEDYELLFTAPADFDPQTFTIPDAPPTVPITRIGTVEDAGGHPGVTILDPHGRPHDGSELGWNH